MTTTIHWIGYAAGIFFIFAALCCALSEDDTVIRRINRIEIRSALAGFGLAIIWLLACAAVGFEHVYK